MPEICVLDDGDTFSGPNYVFTFDRDELEEKEPDLYDSYQNGYDIDDVSDAVLDGRLKGEFYSVGPMMELVDFLEGQPELLNNPKIMELMREIRGEQANHPLSPLREEK